MTEMAETPAAKPRTSPYGVLGLGLVIAFLGALLASEVPGFGFLLIAIGGVLTQFGIIAGAVELAITRTRER